MLTIFEDVTSEEYQKKQLLRQASLLLPEDKLRMLQEILARMPIDDAVDEFRKLRTEQAPEVPTEERLGRLGNKPNNTHEIVESEDEMLQLLDEGWELVMELNGERFLMRIKS